MLTIRNLRKAYYGATVRQVLQGVELDLAAGEYIAIMGESGIGKSTLLNLIAGLDQADEGSIRLNDTDLSTLDETTRTVLRRTHMGFVFQAFHLLPHLTVAQNIALPLALNRVPSQESRSRTETVLEAVGLASRANSYPRELSGGEMQRVAIARAVVHRPQLVLADEPTGNLDPTSADQVLSLLKDQVSDRHAAAILVTHSSAAAATADRVYVLTSQGLQLRESTPG